MLIYQVGRFPNVQKYNIGKSGIDERSRTFGEKGNKPPIPDLNYFLIENTLIQQPDLIWVRTIYWKLDEWSCLLVQRNKKWFEDVVPMISNFWNIIEKERITGYEHRAPIKRNGQS